MEYLKFHCLLLDNVHTGKLYFILHFELISFSNMPFPVFFFSCCLFFTNSSGSPCGIPFHTCTSCSQRIWSNTQICKWQAGLLLQQAIGNFFSSFPLLSVASCLQNWGISVCSPFFVPLSGLFKCLVASTQIVFWLLTFLGVWSINKGLPFEQKIHFLCCSKPWFCNFTQSLLNELQ